MQEVANPFADFLLSMSGLTVYIYDFHVRMRGQNMSSNTQRGATYLVSLPPVEDDGAEGTYVVETGGDAAELGGVGK